MAVVVIQGSTFRPALSREELKQTLHLGTISASAGLPIGKEIEALLTGLLPALAAAMTANRNPRPNDLGSFDDCQELRETSGSSAPATDNLGDPSTSSQPSKSVPPVAPLITCVLVFAHDAGHQQPTDEQVFSCDIPANDQEPCSKRVTHISNEQEKCLAVEKSKGDCEGWRAECEQLTATKLRRRYAREANSHRNMLAREKSRGAVIAPEFRQFRNFLMAVGPMPAKGATLDRINNADPEYGPGKVRWADRRTQNSNKGDSLLFQCARTGKSYTSMQIARKQSVSSATVRKRRLRGWTDDEIILGQKSRGKPEQAPRLSWGHNMRDQPPLQTQTKSRRTMSAREIRYLEIAEEFRQHHEEYGTDPLMAPLEDLNDLCPHIKITEEQYERHFSKFWPDYRPHMRFFDKAHPSHQKLIEKIDPEWVAGWRAGQARIAKLEREL